MDIGSESRKNKMKARYCCDGSNEDDIVITGISGRFPNADNVAEFAEGLYSKKVFVCETDARWPSSLLVNTMGTIKDLSKFDASFFGYHPGLTNAMPPDQRILSEVTYETIVDSGYDPEELKGRNIGVYHANSYDDATSMHNAKMDVNDAESFDRFSVLRSLRCMSVNGISYKYDFHGPSCVVDTACSSSGFALWQAFSDIKNGICDAALVSGSQIILSPGINKSYETGYVLSPSGQCHAFDENADGFIRSEAVTSVFLQKAKEARRIYANIANIKQVQNGRHSEAIFVPSEEAQKKLFRAVYQEIGIQPHEITFFEAHGTGTKVGDSKELKAISEVYCEGREGLLPVGSVKSNIGHTEATSALCSVIKAVITMETGMIPPNINFKVAAANCQPSIEGKMEVVVEPTPWKRGYIGVNNFGVGGVSVHTILKENSLEYDSNEPPDNKIPQLILFAGRTEEGVKVLFDYMENNFVHREFVVLLHKLAYAPISSKPYRGFAVMDKTKNLVSGIQLSPPTKREVWYIFSGVGCQWTGMALDLMELDVFATSMKKSAQVLQPFGIDLFGILKREGNSSPEDRNITLAFVAIAAIQIALVDVLNELGIQPDGIVGHSTGELVCAYADGCFTAEKTILSAYWRGQAIESANLPAGSMAAVALTWEEAIRRCPIGVYVACHNAEDSVTISGLKRPVEKFVATLRDESIFAREVNCSGCTFHCELIKPATPALKNALLELIPEPKPRSSRWISTSYPKEQWDTPEAKMADASYFVNNMESPVRFYDALRCIPKDAITIEIAPHHLLRALLKRVIGPNAEYIGMMQKDSDNIKHLLASIGGMYAAGLNPNIEALYPSVNFPVPRSTPSISNLIRWDHSQSWNVPKYNPDEEKVTVVERIDLKNKDSPDTYLLDHCIDGRALFPATGYLMLAVKAINKIKRKEISETPVVIENFKIRRPTILNNAETVRFEVSILNEGEFEIKESKMCVATGRIYISDEPLFNDPLPDYLPQDTNEIVYGTDIYNELRIEGYEYGPQFRGIIEATYNGNEGIVKWDEKWIPFLDSLLLFFGLITERRGLYLPTAIQSVKIDPNVHYKYLKENSDKDFKGIPVRFNKSTMQCISGGVEIRNLRADIAPRRQTRQNFPTLEEYRFVPYMEPFAMTQKHKETCEDYLQVCCEVAQKLSLLVGKVKYVADFNPCKNVATDDCLNSLTDEHILLTTLKNLSELKTTEEILETLPESFNNYVKNIGRDVLSKTLTREVPLRTVLDVVVENSSSNLSLLELCEERVPLALKVQDMLKNVCHIQVTCTVFHPDPVSVDSEILEKYDIRVIENKTTTSQSLNCQNNDIVVGTFRFGTKKQLKSYIKSLSSAVKSERFILLLHKHSLTAPEAFLCKLCGVALQIQTLTEIEKILVEENLVMICKKCDSLGSSLYLLKKVTPSKASKNNPMVRIVEGRYEEWVETLKKKLHDDIKTLWLVSDDSPLNGLVGLVNCLRQEPGGEKIRCVFLDGSNQYPPFDTEDSLYSEILTKDILMNVYQNGVWGSFRHISMVHGDKEIITQHSYVNHKKIGDLSSFQWIESPLKNRTQHSGREIMCQVYYAALNFKDVMLATGKIPLSTERDLSAISDCVFGMEFSGRDPNGRRLMGLVRRRAVATTVKVHPEFTWEVPEEWTMEEASTVPGAYATSYYALFIKGHLKKGESILIHSGAGGVGQAAIRIALSIECEIFTTVGTDEKRKFLKETFPQLKDQNIGCSRDTSFEYLVLEQTQGKGVNVVLNCLADDKLQASLRCVANHGRFLEIGKYDLFMDHTIGLNVFLKSVSFIGVFLDAFVGDEFSNEKLVYQYISEGIQNGVVKPMNTTIFNRNEVDEAFKFMASGTHIGKVVIKIRDEEPEKVIIPKPLSVPAAARTYFNSEKCYIVIGGLGGFGIELIKWMLTRGARNIVITSRSGAASPYHNLCLQRWKKEGFIVVVWTLNVANRDEANKLMKDSALIAPIGGIFNLAMVLKDALMANQTAKNFEEVCAPKVEGTKNLDELSRLLCPELDWFVCFSSISCGKGNPGQSNYGFANSVMERICERRKTDGFHGLAIQWGLIADVGVFYRAMGDKERVGRWTPQRIKSCLSTLDTFLQGEHPVVCSYVNAEILTKKGDKESLLNQLANIFGLKSYKEFDPYRSFGEMGIDSLMATEIKILFETHVDVAFNMQEAKEWKIADVEKYLEKHFKKMASGNAEAIATEKAKFIIPDELIPNEALVSLNAESNGIPLFVVSLTEVIAPVLKALAEILSCPVYGLRCTRDIPTTTLKDMALWHLKMIQKSYPDGPISVVGYSYGAIVAFEMALQSQESDSFPPMNKLILLNCSPLINVLSGSDRNDDAKEDARFFSFAQQYAKSDISELRGLLMSLPSFEAKRTELQKFMTEFSDGGPKREELSAAIENYCKRLEIVEMYEAKQHTLRKDLFVVEVSNTPDVTYLETAKTALSQVSEGNICVENVEGTVQYFGINESNNAVASLINKFLC